jgi:hypothetical protein
MIVSGVEVYLLASQYNVGGRASSLDKDETVAPLKTALNPCQGPSVAASRIPESSLIVHVGRDSGFTEVRVGKG